MVAKDVAEVKPLPRGGKGDGGAQIRRFLILHKELDADDGRIDPHAESSPRVRRRALCRPGHVRSTTVRIEADISTEVTYEDGHKGVIAARVKIRDLQTSGFDGSSGEGRMRAPDTNEILLQVEGVSLGVWRREKR